MNTKVKDILRYLDELAPTALKMDFDNVGLLVGNDNCDVTAAVIALDITDDVISEAAEYGAELIISHHPVIFNPLKSVVESDIVSRKIIKLVKQNISAICMHTNLDIAEGGVNDALMDVLGAEVSGILEPTDENSGCGRIGTISAAMTMPDFLSHCKSALNSKGLRYFDAGRPVKKIAVMGGSGGDCLELAVEKGCDTYITSDIKYNVFLDAKDYGINLIDADHFCTENVIVPVLYDKLSKMFPDVNFIISKRHGQTASFF